MKSIIGKTTMLVALSAALLSFSSTLGGEGFEISLNNKVLLQRYGSNINEVQNISLDQNASSGQLAITYYHCGRVGKNRVVSIRDGENKMVKEWHFADVATPLAAMNCNVSEILNLKKTNTGTFKLYYSSSELPKGRLLANIIVEYSRTIKK